jgi:hypothetical protein
VWHDSSGDDFYCDPSEVDYWMPMPELPIDAEMEGK